MHSFFQSQKNKLFIYHNLVHTQSVVKAASQIANHYQLNEKDFFIVTTSAWFHDAGYFEDMNNHETKGTEMAATFLRKNGVPEDIIQTITGCIIATRLPQNPKNKLEEIVCDADLFHLGTDDFAENNKLMRKEAEAKKGAGVGKDEWRKGTIRLFETHHYYTDYCQLLLNDKKKENLEKLKKRAAEKEEKNKPNDQQAQKNNQPVAKDKAVPAVPAENADLGSATAAAIPGLNPDVKKKKEEKLKRPDRGIETMFRITSGNNQRLSDMADNKSHIMITVNSIILSAIISLLLRKLEEYDFLKWPTFLTLAVCVTTIIFSILATRPSIPSGRFSQQDIDDKKVNLLFFGNFYRMNLQDYTSGMLQVMGDRDFLYGTLIKDVYSQGVVLGRKYRLLRISYNIFMYGLIASVLAFVIATIAGGS
ncbi:MAG TPA: Pycsar system effector family protein [Chitinophagaceae bacterium]|nr:Pycsar system effector family protein [Chitinophagaceae bacterium]